MKSREGIRRGAQASKHLAASDPENSSKQVDIVELHVRMGQLTQDSQASDHANEAFRLYNAVAARSGFTPTVKPDEGAVMLVFLKLAR